MKKLIIFLFVNFLSVFSIVLHAQEDVTKFLGIPVDGSKSEMIQKLKAKGFTNTSSEKDILEGEFNGRNVIITIATKGNKVYRIMVQDSYPVDEGSIKIRFNNLAQQFLNNKKYSPLFLISNYILPEDENISYELLINKKQYQAVFWQRSVADSALIEKEMQSIAWAKYAAEMLSRSDVLEKLSGLTEEVQKFVITTQYLMEQNYLKKIVWFTISEDTGKYRITIFYDNKHNEANGEDL